MATNNYSDIQFAIKVVNDASKSLNQIEKDLLGLANATTKSSTQMKRSLDSVDSSIVKMQAGFKQLRTIGLGLSATVTAPLVLLGKKAVTVAAQFEQSMANAFSVLTDSSKATREELTAFAEQLGRDTAFKASEAADAMYKLASAGLEVNEIMGSLPGILDAAAATQSDLASVAEQTTVAMKTFNIEAENAGTITDAMVAAITNSNLNFERLTESMKFAGPAMATFGKSVEETYTALGFFADAGIFGAKAGTLLRGMLSRLANPTSELLSVFNQLGISIEDVNPQFKSVAEILDTLNNSGISTAQVFQGFGRIVAGPIALSLQRLNDEGKSAAEIFGSLQSEIERTGTASKVAGIQLDTLAGAWKILGSSLDNLFIQFKKDVFGDALKNLVESFIELTNYLAELEPATKKFIVAILGVLAVAGPVALVIGAIGTALTTALGPIGLVAVSIGLLIPILIKVKSYFDDWLDSFGNIDSGNIEQQLNENVKNPILKSIIDTRKEANLELEKFKKDISDLKLQNVEVDLGVEGATSELLQEKLIKGLESNLSTILNITKKSSKDISSALDEQINKRIEVIKVMQAQGDISQETAAKMIQSAREETETFRVENDKIIKGIQALTTEINSETDKINPVLSEDDTAELKRLLDQQTALAVQSLGGTKDEIAKIQKLIGQQQQAIAIENLQDLITIQEEQSKETIKLAKEQYDGLIEESERYAANATGEDKRIAEERVALYKDQKDTLIKNAVEAKIALVNQAVLQAKALGGVYDAQNNKILTGNKAWWFKIKEGAKAGGAILLIAIRQIGRNIISIFTNVMFAVWKTVRDTLADVGDAWEKLKDGQIIEAGKAMKEALSPKELAKEFAGTFLTEFGNDIVKNAEQASKESAEVWKEYNANVGKNLDFETELAKITAEVEGVSGSIKGLTDEERAAAIAAQIAAEQAAAAAESAGSSADNSTDRVKELGKELEDLGVFAIKSGDEIIDSFDNAEDGIKKLDSEMKKLNEQFKKQQEEVAKLSADIEERLGKFEIKPEALTSMDMADEKFKGIKESIEEVLTTHDKWIDTVTKDLENFSKLLDDINKKFDEQKQKITEQATEDITGQYTDALNKIQELQTAREKALAEGDNVADLNNQIDDVQKLINEFEKLKNSTVDYVSEIEKARDKLEELKAKDASEGQITQQEEQLAILLGKQKIFVDEKDKLEQQLADAQASRNLSEIDFIAYKLGKELQAIETKRKAELKAAQEINAINNAIVSGEILDEGFIGGLKENDYSAESIAFAEEAQKQEITYREKLQKQLADLTKFQEESSAIYASMTADYINQQKILEEYVSLSVNNMIQKYNQLAEAARAAAAAQKKVLAGRSSAVTSTGLKSGGFADLLGYMRGGFVNALKGFDTGGYTGAGKADAVAGVVHKGEWVAPKWLVNAMRPTFNALESVRKSKNVGAIQNTSKSLNNNINMTNYIKEQVDFKSVARNLSFELSKL